MYTHCAEQVKKLDIGVSSAKVILATPLWVDSRRRILDEESH